MAAVHDAQLRIPQDVAIVGFDDRPAARMVHPPLTTIAQFQDELGSKAAALLLQRLTGTLSPAGRSVEMPYQLTTCVSGTQQCSGMSNVGDIS